MYPKVEHSFFDAKIPAKLVFDMVYNPLDTLLLRMAADQGATIIRGLEIVEQIVTTGAAAPPFPSAPALD